MSTRATRTDSERSDHARHELLSAGTAPLALVSTPQTAFEVTTLADVVDAGDGLLSLREAIEQANGAAGRDTITFAEDLRGGRIVLDETLGTLRITSDLVIDGDPLDRVRVVDIRPEDRPVQGITIDGGRGNFIGTGILPFEVDGSYARFEDMTIERAYFSAIKGVDNAQIRGERLAVQFINGSFAGANTIDMEGGSLQLRESAIGYTTGNEQVVGIRLNNSIAQIENSSINFTGAEEGGFGILGSGSLLLADSQIGYASGADGGALRLDGRATIRDSTIRDSGGQYFSGSAVEVSGILEFLNSTIVSAIHGDEVPTDGAIAVRSGSRADIVNSTITGTETRVGFEDGPGNGIVAEAGSEVRIINSVVDDSVIGAIASNGANTFRDISVDGAVSGDRVGVRAEDVFALTEEIGSSGVRRGVLADNGGPTETVALANTSTNPALDRAAVDDVPDAQDQRGFFRDASPDIGAFELDATDPGFVVTTLEDTADVDGVVSLREAIANANRTPGLDTITFADSLANSTIALVNPLVVSDDVIIDGDEDDRGPGGITIEGGAEGVFPSQLVDPGTFITFGIYDSAARLEDLTIRGSGGSAIRSTDADVALERVLITGVSGEDGGGPALAVSLTGGNLSVTDSVITRVGSEEFGVGIFMNDADVRMENSRLYNAGSTYTGAGIRGSGRLHLIDSEIMDVGAVYNGVGILLDGDLIVENSTIADVGFFEGGKFLGGAIDLNGNLRLVNSTVAGNRGDQAILLDGSGTSQIINSTITGTFNPGDELSSDERSATPTKGIAVADGSMLIIQNSIIDDTIDGEVISNGANTFREDAVAGAVAGDEVGVRAEQLFALTKEIGTSGVRSGVLADNGGPTATVALRDDPANPALDAADAAVAPALDQRGFARDAAPDIGAFELDAAAPPVSTLPQLMEKAPLADAEIRGAPRGNFVIGAAGDAEIGFVDEVGAFQSSLGVYLIGPDGGIRGAEWVFERIEHALPSDAASATARPGGGPLLPGESVLLSELFDPAELAPGTEFGLFLAADAWARNPASVFEGGWLEFRTNGDPATITDTTPSLFHIAADGAERLVMGDILHSVDAGPPDPLANPLNPGGMGQVTSGILDGAFVVAFEDKPLAASDRDFNDALFAIDLRSDGVAGAGASLPATDMTPLVVDDTIA